MAESHNGGRRVRVLPSGRSPLDAAERIGLRQAINLERRRRLGFDVAADPTREEVYAALTPEGCAFSELQDRLQMRKPRLAAALRELRAQGRAEVEGSYRGTRWRRV
jgi:hypothetical protein